MTQTNNKKYLGTEVAVVMDRQLGSKHPKHGFVYECNYGYLPDTVAADGEEIDAYVLGVTEPLEKFTGTCVAIIHRTNDVEDKLVVVPKGISLTDEEIRTQTHFQEQWFESVIVR